MIELSGGAALFGVILILVMLSRLSTLEKRLRALSSLNGKLDALLKHSEVEYNPYGDLPAEVIKALKRGEKIQAIKHYRDATGAGLKEAKEFIEEVQRRSECGA
jgi:ribosomal protein L7/L12